MAYVPVPKDLTRVKTKVVFNLTKRQLICFSIAGVIGIPLYIYTRKNLGNNVSMMLMVLIMLPFFFLAMYEKDGLPFEKYLKYIIYSKFINPKIRIYKTENFYEYLGKEDMS